MLLTEIDGVSSKTAEKLANNGLKIAEEVAYHPIFEVTHIDGVNANVYANAQKLVLEQSNTNRGKSILRNQIYWCRQCDMQSVVGAATFKQATTAASHHNRCDACDPNYNIY
jgi:hypothetical protein